MLFRFQDHNSSQTETLKFQLDLEKETTLIYGKALRDIDALKRCDCLLLQRERHIRFLKSGLLTLPAGFISLDASRTWICYWILHSLNLLGAPEKKHSHRRAIIDFLSACQHERGGFGGGPGQLPHLATSYSAIAALVSLGTEGCAVIDRDGLMRFFLEMCVSSEDGGGMTMHSGGEVDVRGCYCALACCHMLCMDADRVANACDMVNYIRKCQSYEGGIGGEPGNEAHGGYTFCAFGALALIEKEEALDMELLKSWLVRMQGRVEGGFRGRTNKLVDGCYSWWQGGLVSILLQQQVNKQNKQACLSADLGDVEARERIDAFTHTWLSKPSNDLLTEMDAVCRKERDALEKTTSKCIEIEQEYEENPTDENRSKTEQAESTVLSLQQSYEYLNDQCVSYSTSKSCYELFDNDIVASSEHHDDSPLCDMKALQLWLLLACQIADKGGMRDKPGKRCDYYHTCYCLSGLAAAQECTGFLLGGEVNRLAPVHPICNVVQDKILESQQYFKGIHHTME
eukprot:jgi/Picsp_1/1355/NSC_04835-R1_farnesyl protein transferase subunit b